MAFFRVYPRQAEAMYHDRSSQDVFGDALLAGLSQGMSDLEQLLGPYHRARPCPNRGPSGATSRNPTRRVPTTRDPPCRLDVVDAGRWRTRQTPRRKGPEPPGPPGVKGRVPGADGTVPPRSPAP